MKSLTKAIAILCTIGALDLQAKPKSPDFASSLTGATVEKIVSGKSVVTTSKSDKTSNFTAFAFFPNVKPETLMALFWDYPLQATYAKGLNRLEISPDYSQNEPLMQAKAWGNVLGIKLKPQMMEYTIGKQPGQYWSEWKAIPATVSGLKSAVGGVAFESFQGGTLMIYYSEMKTTSNLASFFYDTGLRGAFKDHVKFYKTNPTPTATEIANFEQAVSKSKF